MPLLRTMSIILGMMSIGATREYALTKWTRAEKKINGAATLFYGLGTMCIVPLRGKTDLSTIVQVQSLGMAWEGVRHPRPPDP